MENVVIREATAEELDAIADLLVTAYSQYDPDDFEHEGEREGWQDYLREVGNTEERALETTQLVAIEGDTPLGAVSYYSRGEYRPLDLATEEDWAGIRFLGVSPAGRGRGLGRALTEACINRARAEGAVGIALHTTKKMAIARNMYERMGFTRDEDLDLYPFDEGDFVVMGYRLAL